jgi:sulfide:quinone oxidoreductase
MTVDQHHQVVIVGGGTAGITVAARLTRGWFRRTDVAIIEPSDKHYYQPLWTLVGAGAARIEESERDEAQVIPRRATWIRDAVVEFRPQEQLVLTRAGRTIGYDWLVVAVGIRIRWDGIRGLREAIGQGGVCTNYDRRYVLSTWEALQNFRGGTALFTQPSGAIKCGGAPQKIMYLADDYFRRVGVREKSRIVFATPANKIFGIEKYRAALERVVARKQIETLFRHDLVEIRPAAKAAVFRNLDANSEVVLPYDLLHVTPPMGPPDVVACSPLADAQGWVEVDQYTLQHPRFPNVFALGDCSSLPTSKTAAAVRKQAPVLVANLRAAMHGEPLTARYNGYTSCPVVTGYGKLILAEFDYNHQPAETFPFDQAQERCSMYLLKRYLLPLMYWQGMLKGRL